MQIKKDSQSSVEDKSLSKSNTKEIKNSEIKKTQRPKNVIRRETQEKLKQL